MQLTQLLEKTLDKIKVSDEEIKNIKNKLFKLEKELSKKNIRFFIGGSFAKNTFIRPLKDVDIYLLMDKEDDSLIKYFYNSLKEISKKLNMSFRVLEGSRTYFHVYNKDIKFELVPILELKENDLLNKRNLNSTDISKYHVEFVKEEVRKNPRIADEIRLFKYFLKRKNLYGSESYKKAFSGYLSEVLIINFGSFLNAINFFANAKLPINLVEDKYKKIMIKKNKWNDFFNISDPVFKERNLGMALDKENVIKLIWHSKFFLIRPNFEKFSEEKEILRLLKDEIIIEKYNLLILKQNAIYPEKELNPDIIGTKMKKNLEKIVNYLNINGFEVLTSSFNYNPNNFKSVAYILVSKYQNNIRKGPFYEISVENLIKFIDKHKDKIFLLDASLKYLEESVNLDDLLIKIIEELELINSKYGIKFDISMREK